MRCSASKAKNERKWADLLGPQNRPYAYRPTTTATAPPQRSLEAPGSPPSASTASTSSPCTLTWTPSARPMQRCRRDERAEHTRTRRTRAHSASHAHHVHNPYRSRCQRRQQHSCHQNICMLTTSRSSSSSRCRRVKVNVTKVHESERLALAARLRHPTHPSSIKRAAEHVDANIVVHASGSAASGRRRSLALLFSR